MKNQVTIAIVSAYVVVAMLSFGYGYNRCDFDGSPTNEESCGMAVMSPYWPVYWGFRAAIEVTKP